MYVDCVIETSKHLLILFYFRSLQSFLCPDLLSVINATEPKETEQNF
jgi:hypothetical protein